MKELDEYIETMKFEGLSDNSVRTYKNHLEAIVRDFKITDISQFESLDESAWEIYDKHMAYDEHLSPNYRSLRLTSVRRFYDWLIKRHYLRLEKNPVQENVKIKLVRERTYMTMDQMDAFLNACDTKRNKAMFSFLFDTGARFSEMAQIKIEDVSEKVDPLTKQHFCGVSIVGKGGKRRSLGITINTMALIMDYLQNEHPDPRPDNYLFVSKDNSKVKDDSLNETIKYIARMAGIPNAEHMRMHSCRHSFASKRAEQGCDPIMLQRMMGHSSMNTTRQYIHYDEERSAAYMAGVEETDMGTYTRDNKTQTASSTEIPSILTMIMDKMNQNKIEASSNQIVKK